MNMANSHLWELSEWEVQELPGYIAEVVQSPAIAVALEGLVTAWAPRNQVMQGKKRIAFAAGRGDYDLLVALAELVDYTPTGVMRGFEES
jgi:hypothetical protein